MKQQSKEDGFAADSLWTERGPDGNSQGLFCFISWILTL